MISFGGGSSKSSSSSQPVRVDMFSPEQWRVFRQLGSTVEAGQQQEVPAYPGQMYTPKTPEEQAYFEYLKGLPGQMPGREQALETTLSGKPAYQIDPNISSDYFEKAIRPIAEREYRETTLPALAESFVGPGYYGTARATALARAGEKFGEGLAAQKAGLTYSDELARRAALESAAGRQAQVALPAMEAGIEDIGTAGQYARMIEQEKQLANYQRWLAGETVDGVSPEQYNPFLQLAMQYLQQQPYSYGTASKSSGTSTQYGIGLLSGPGGGQQTKTFFG